MFKRKLTLPLTLIVCLVILSGCQSKNLSDVKTVDVKTADVKTAKALETVSAQTDANREELESSIQYYVDHSGEDAYRDEIANRLYKVYKSMSLEALILEIDSYSHSIQNSLSSYLIYGIWESEACFDNLQDRLDALTPRDHYAYFSERLKADLLIDQPNELHLEDDAVEKIDDLELENEIMAAESLDELIQLSLTYSFDGVFSEDFAARLAQLYNSQGFESFLSQSLVYGPPIQASIACELAYGLSYDEDASQALLDHLDSISLTDENRYFIDLLIQKIQNPY